MAQEFDAMGNPTGVTAPDKPAQAAPAAKAPLSPDKDIRQMQGLMRITGNYKGPVNGIADKATNDGITNFLKERQIDLSKTPKDQQPAAILQQMRTEVSTSPRAVATMQALKAEGTPDSISAMQYGLQAFGAPVAATGKLENASNAALDRLAQPQKQDLRDANDPRRVDRPQQQAAKPAIDPDVQKIQGYMRGLGITEVEVNGKKQSVDVTGRLDPATNAAMAKYKADNNLDNNDSFASVMKHMEDRIKQNPADMQQRLADTAAQGPNANPMNVMAMQLILNLLAPIMSALTGGKINMEQLKVDGINGPRTSNGYNGYRAATSMTAKPEVKPEAKPEVKPEAKPVSVPNTTAPKEEIEGKDGKWRPADTPAEAQPTAVPAAARPNGTYTERGPDGAPVTVNPADYERPRTPRYEEPAAREPLRVTTAYNRASGLDQVNRMLDARNELERQGYAPALAKQEVNRWRTEELMNSGMTERQAKTQAGYESRMADRQERYESRSAGRQQTYDTRAQNDYDRDVRRAIKEAERAEKREARAEEREIRQSQRDWNDIARSGVTLGGGSSREASAAGRLAGGIAGIAGRMMSDGDSSGTSAREAKQFSRDTSDIARGAAIIGGSSSREANALGKLVGGVSSIGSRMFGAGEETVTTRRVVTYPQQNERPGYVPQARLDQGDFSLERGNQISTRMAGAANDGVTAQQRQQIIAEYEAQRNAPAAPEQAMPNNRRPMEYSGPA